MDEFIEHDCLTTFFAGKWLNLIVLKFSKETVVLIVVLIKYSQVETQQLKSAISHLIS